MKILTEVPHSLPGTCSFAVLDALTGTFRDDGPDAEAGRECGAQELRSSLFVAPCAPALIARPRWQGG